jgi:hypothetical protein
MVDFKPMYGRLEHGHEGGEWMEHWEWCAVGHLEQMVAVPDKGKLHIEHMASCVHTHKLLAKGDKYFDCNVFPLLIFSISVGGWTNRSLPRR